MAYRIAGKYVVACDCRLVCPCPVDGPPTGADGGCTAATVFTIREGNLDDVDLAGVTFALFSTFPSNLSAGNWKVGVVVDEGASDAQAQAVERILSGQEGGPFGEFAPLIGEYLGTERGSVKYSDGETPSGEVADTTKFSYEPFRGLDGSPTTEKNAMFGFAPEFGIGRSSGQSSAFGMSFGANYGEAADYDFSTEVESPVRGR